MRKIYIVQHCQSEHHINNLTGGWTDTLLTEFGMKQAEKVADELERLGLKDDFDLYSSDLQRASMTAQAIEKKFDVKMILDKTLREHNNGMAANKTDKWAENNLLISSLKIELDKPLWEEAETFRELYERMKGFNDNILKNTERDIVIVSHGVAIGYFIRSYLKFDCDSITESFLRGKAGGISILSKSTMGQDTLDMFNSISHLREN